MDFKKLVEPYSENGRTVGGQILWLTKRGLPSASIEFAVSQVYKSLELGATFPDGHSLDQELLKVASDHHKQDLELQLAARIEGISANLDSEWNKLTKWQKLWQVLKGEA